ncbi:MAG: hypothetical protein M3143_13210 [Actinomycetota bacterium]|nr:hypothetical protein [Actinomycetota bacterium]
MTAVVNRVLVDDGSRHGAPRVAGATLAVIFDAMTRLRRGKPIHPRGIVARAMVERTGSTYGRWDVPWLDEPGTDVGIVRFSRAAGLPAPAPDVLGLALRLEAVGTQHDLLLATTGMRPGWRHVLFPRRHALRVPYGSLLPYDAARRRVLIAAIPEAGAPYGISAVDVGRALEPASRTFQLMVATLLGNWMPFARLTVARDVNVFDMPVAFDPVLNPLPGLPLGQPFRSLREPAYRAARRARRNQAGTLEA